MIHELPLHNVARLEAAVKIQHQQCHDLDTMTDINHTGSHLCQNIFIANVSGKIYHDKFDE